MKVALYADDFTGAVDSMLQFRRAGLSGVLATGLEHASEAVRTFTPEACDVVGVAGLARSLPTERLDAEIAPVLRWMASSGASVVQYKACSTADSSPDRGNVCELATDALGPQAVPAVFAQPDFGRFTFFGHHFAAEAGCVHRLDRQPTMRSHPATPMTDSDLAAHLRTQTDLAVENLVWTRLEDLDAGDLSGREPRIVVCDTFTDAHLDTLGRAIIASASPDRPRFVLGSGGISLGLGHALGRGGVPLPDTATATTEPCLVLCGSRSPRSWAQIRAAGAAGWSVVDLRGSAAVADTVRLHGSGRDTILHTTDPDAAPMREDEVVAGLVAAGRACVSARPRSRLVLCGGDTCGAVLRGLEVSALSLAATPWGNVVLCTGHRPGAAIEVVLKGGQMGETGLFESIRRGVAAPGASATEGTS